MKLRFKKKSLLIVWTARSLVTSWQTIVQEVTKHVTGKVCVTVFIQQVVKLTHSEVKQFVWICSAGQRQGEVQTLDSHSTALFRDIVCTFC